MVQELDASEFTRLPEALHYRGEPTEWAKAVRPGKRLHSFLEGPSFDRDGNLYVSDTPHGRIFRIDPDGRWETTVAYEGQPNGLAFHHDGRLFVADHHRGILTVDPSSGRMDELTDAPFLGLSDLTFKSNGDLYFTDAGHTSLRDPSGRVFRLGADGRLECLFSGVPYPNGIVFDALESEGFVAATRANAVWKFSSDASMVGSFIQLSGGLGPDGLAMNIEGHLAIAHARNGTVWVVDPKGDVRYKIRTPGQSVTNVAYGGRDHKTLYITEADHGAILRVELDIPGMPLFSHQ